MTLLLALLATLDAATLDQLARGDPAQRTGALAAVVAAGDAQSVPLLQAMLDGRLLLAPQGPPLVLDEAGALHEAITGAPRNADPDELEKVTVNNRFRRELQGALRLLALRSDKPAERAEAAAGLEQAGDSDALPAVEAALQRERDGAAREALAAAAASLGLASGDRSKRLAAVAQLQRTPGSSSKRQLVQRLPAERDPEVHRAIERALESVEGSLKRAELFGLVFSGLSLASILLLAALGLAITFGLMGVINMAHGELLMIGAYATWLVQQAFRGSPHFGWYLLAAVPASFLAAALVGVLLEIFVVRKLYGRPLETLLATWGASLLIMQAVRLTFGAQNVEVANPAWLSGGIALLPGLVVPWNRIAVLAFAGGVLLLVHLLLTRTRLGLLVRAVTQDRQRAAGLGVATPRLDLLAFALGSGIAGLGGCALSQLGNVGPELGQGFIVDSFMVVVLGGVGQLSGSLLAATVLGILNKLLEPAAGAVLAKIAVLVLVILFIQRRPQGFFALRRRAMDET